MIILHDPKSLAHKTIELLGAKVIPALESPERITSILRSVKQSSHDVREPEPITSGENQQDEDFMLALRLSHEQGYVKHLELAHADWVKAGLISEDESLLPECFHFSTRAGSRNIPPSDIYARAGFYAFDMSSGIMSQTWSSTIASARLAFQGMDLVTTHGLLRTVETGAEGPHNRDTFALCRPPGHHCDTRRAGGYCYINNAVVAVQGFQNKFPGKRVGILDIDFHHGNGTQDHFYDRSDVLYVSIHGENEFPYYTGHVDETGTGDGEGFNFNLPLKTKSSVAMYMEKLGIALQRLDDFNPDFLVVSLGFDTFHLDPLGGFEIETQDYTKIAHCIRSRLQKMPALILLEGGYVLESLGKNVLAFLSGWESAK